MELMAGIHAVIVDIMLANSDLQQTTANPCKLLGFKPLALKKLAIPIQLDYCSSRHSRVRKFKPIPTGTHVLSA